MSRSTSDRRVHAWTPDGAEVVRYERAGKWYLEHPPATGKERTSLTLAGAVQHALAAHRGGGRVFLRRPGGGQFDTRFLAATTSRSHTRPVRVDASDSTPILSAARDDSPPQEAR